MEITQESVELLNDSFGDILREGSILKSGPLPVEKDHLDLPRIVVPHSRRSYGRLRQLIDMVNTCETL